MANKADRRRRTLGTTFLGLAVTMLVMGQTVLRDRLSATGFLLFWAACFIFTFLAMATALLDFSVVRRRTRQERRELLDQTLAGIAREKEARSRESRETD